jgi:hypothetical protein
MSQNHKVADFGSKQRSHVFLWLASTTDESWRNQSTQIGIERSFDHDLV